MVETPVSWLVVVDSAELDSVVVGSPACVLLVVVNTPTFRLFVTLTHLIQLNLTRSWSDHLCFGLFVVNVVSTLVIGLV